MKKVIIIGATSGIGKALAEIFYQESYTIGIAGRREDVLKALQKKLQEKHSGKVFFQKMDIQDLLSLESNCNDLVNQLGGLDLLIFSAGIGEENKDLIFDIDNNVMKTNIQGFIFIANWGMKFFKAQGYGHFVNISSVAGIRGNGIAASYNASKAYQINYLEGLRINAQKFRSNITITDVRPGFVETAMAKGDGQFWVASVQKAALQILQAIKAKKNVVYITKRWVLIGYFLKLIPFSILKRL